MISLVAIILSFFLILVSFTANIKDNSWEFGVLRAIGLTINQLSRIYIYEALILVVASGLIGTIVGIVIAVTLTLQILMFMELPFQFVFPYT
jgi:ABC-type antimicrobial peptide transport system permease subunit